MALVNGRYTPESITSITRKTTPSTSRVIIRTRVPTLANPSPYDYVTANISVGQTAATRKMIQKVNTANFYEFTFPPTQIAYEGMGLDIQEIPRPLLAPLIDIRGSKNYKAVFEFLVAEQFDGLSTNVEQQLVTLEWFANTGEPVYFENFDTFLTNGFWYIAEFAVKTSRVNTNGKIVAAQCSMGLLEYQPTENKFAKFPKLNYTPTSSRNRGGGSGTGTGGADGSSETPAEKSEREARERAAAFEAQTITAYRWLRTTEPSSTEVYKNSWIKVKGKNQWVLYSRTSTFPYKTLYGNEGTIKLQGASKITPTMTDAKARYERSINNTDARERALLNRYPGREADFEVVD
jgi:hypothetical protein